MDILIRNGSYVDEGNYDEFALHFTVEAGHVDVAKVLLHVNAADWNKTALHIAAQEITEHVDVVKVLIQNGADVNAVLDDGTTALHFAVSEGHTDFAKVLIQNGTDVNAVTRKWTALMFAASRAFGHCRSADSEWC